MKIQSALFVLVGVMAGCDATEPGSEGAQVDGVKQVKMAIFGVGAPGLDSVLPTGIVRDSYDNPIPGDATDSTHPDQQVDGFEAIVAAGAEVASSADDETSGFGMTAYSVAEGSSTTFVKYALGYTYATMATTAQLTGSGLTPAQALAMGITNHSEIPSSVRSLTAGTELCGNGVTSFNTPNARSIDTSLASAADGTAGGWGDTIWTTRFTECYTSAEGYKYNPNTWSWEPVPRGTDMPMAYNANNIPYCPAQTLVKTLPGGTANVGLTLGLVVEPIAFWSRTNNQGDVLASQDKVLRIAKDVKTASRDLDDDLAGKYFTNNVKTCEYVASSGPTLPGGY